jgi:lipid II:glycine glycyltransferase (peptidoglycan interpeptide bridge formation enzyme)
MAANTQKNCSQNTLGLRYNQISMKAHFLQSDIWKTFQIELGRQIIEGTGEGWSYSGLIENDRFGKYIYIPYGPFAKNKTSLKRAVNDLKIKAKKAKAYVVYIEPTPPITPAIASELFTHSGYHRQAHRTIVVDLSPDEETLIANMNATRRNEHRNYHKKGLVIAKNNTKEAMEAFYELLNVSSREKKFYIRDKLFFDRMFETMVQSGNASLFTAKKDNKIEAAALVYDDDDTRYYAQIGRNLSEASIQANGPLISYVIIDAKKSGKKFFDLYGISESDNKVDERSGFTAFKKTFGGQIVQFAGAWEIPIDNKRYHLKKILTKIKKITTI